MTFSNSTRAMSTSPKKEVSATVACRGGRREVLRWASACRVTSRRVASRQATARSATSHGRQHDGSGWRRGVVAPRHRSGQGGVKASRRPGRWRRDTAARHRGVAAPGDVASGGVAMVGFASGGVRAGGVAGAGGKATAGSAASGSAADAFIIAGSGTVFGVGDARQRHGGRKRSGRRHRGPSRGGRTQCSGRHPGIWPSGGRNRSGRQRTEPKDVC